MLKRLSMLLLLATLWAGHSARAQGTFTFVNRDITVGLFQPVLDGSQGLTIPMVAALFLNGTQFGPVAPFRTGSGAGYWNPGANAIREIPGTFSGDVVNGFTVKVWDSSKGQTYETSRSAGGKSGESNAFSITMGGARTDPLLPADLPGYMTNFQGFNIMIPEPSTLALGALGAVVLVQHRRRGKSPK